MQDLPTELGRTMRKWRTEQEGGWTMERAADFIDVAKSTWSALENGVRPISLETARALSVATGVSIDELVRQGGRTIRQSKNPPDRLLRAAAAAEVIPGLGDLMDMFPDLEPDDVDLLLSTAESLRTRRRRGRK